MILHLASENLILCIKSAFKNQFQNFSLEKNQCIPHFVKIVELLWKPVISTIFPHCGIVFFHSNSTHSILYSDQSVEILRKFLAYLRSVEKM